MTEKRRVAVAGAIVLTGYAWFLFRHNAFCVGGSDSSGYINAARRMATGTLVEPPRTLERLGLSDSFLPMLIPLGFVTGPKTGTMAPFYPSGFPAHMALAAAFLGWARGPYLVSLICAVGSLWLFYLLAQELGLSRSWAAAGTAILAAWPIFLFQSFQPMSDVAATFWSLAAVPSALRARRRTIWSLAAGASFGIAVLVRPTSVLLTVPLALALPISFTSLALFGLGGIPFAASLVAYNLRCYGKPLQSGYQKGTLWSDLGLAYFPLRFHHYAGWVGRTLTPLTPLAWAAAAFDRRIVRRERLLLISWFGVFFLFHCFYQPYDSFTYARFLLPAVPALLVGALLVLRDLLVRIPRRPARFAAASLLTLVVLADERAWTRRLGILSIAQSETAYPRACALAERAVPAGGIILTMQTSGSLEYYTRLSYLRWDLIEPDRWSFLLARARPAGRRWFALVFPFEIEQLAQHTPGRWREVGRVDQISLLALEP